jgi:hypothetical protein
LGLNGDVSIKNMSIFQDKKQIIVPVFIEGDININFDDIKLIDDKGEIFAHYIYHKDIYNSL